MHAHVTEDLPGQTPPIDMCSVHVCCMSFDQLIMAENEHACTLQATGTTPDSRGPADNNHQLAAADLQLFGVVAPGVNSASK